MIKREPPQPAYPWKTKRRYPLPGEPQGAEARRLVKAVSLEFLHALAHAMITGPAEREVALDPRERRRMLYWLGRGGRFETARVHPYTLPHPFDPARPLVMRVSVNYTSVDDIDRLIKKAGWVERQRELRSEPQLERWKMELSVLPRQLVGFVPWVEALVRAHDEGDASLVPEPPDPVRLWSRELLDCDYTWSTAAWDRYQEYDEAVPPRLRHLVFDGIINRVNWERIIRICPGLSPIRRRRALPKQSTECGRESPAASQRSEVKST